MEGVENGETERNTLNRLEYPPLWWSKALTTADLCGCQDAFVPTMIRSASIEALILAGAYKDRRKPGQLDSGPFRDKRSHKVIYSPRLGESLLLFDQAVSGAILMSVTLFPLAPRPANEVARNQAVEASGLLTLQNDGALNAIASEARRVAAADWAGVALITGELQCVIASSGGQIGRYDRSRSMTAYAILKPDAVLNLPDAKADHRFAANPFVRTGLIRFFVAAPIVNAQGLALGALCVSSRSPRQPADEETVAQLQALAAEVMRHALWSPLSTGH